MGYLFMYMLFLFSSLSMSVWFYVWLSLEFSLLSLLPLLILNQSKTSYSSSSLFKYFSIQSFASICLLMSGYCMFQSMQSYVFMKVLFIMSLLIKMGLFPGHFWVVPVAGGLSFINLFFVLGLQKVPPMAMLFLVSAESDYHLSMILFTSLGTLLSGALVGNSSSKMSTLLAGSSISQGGWMMMSCYSGGLFFFMAIYLATMLGLVFALNYNNFYMSSFLMMSLSGLPPGMLFLPKLNILLGMISCINSYFFILLIVLTAVLSLPFYIRASTSLLFCGAQESSMNFKKMLGFVLLYYFGSIMFMVY